jgi:hypothetical protein
MGKGGRVGVEIYKVSYIFVARLFTTRGGSANGPILSQKKSRPELFLCIRNLQYFKQQT